MTVSGQASRVETELFRDDGTFPNNPRLPLRLYRGALPAGADAVERLFAAAGWTNAWQAGVYDFDHYHSTAHEVLGVVRGTARLMLGGPAGRAVTLAMGDAIVLPAGTAHRCLGASDGFLVVGAYAEGRDWDICREDSDIAATRQRIAALPDPKRDPVTGALYLER